MSYNARAELFICSLNLWFSDVPVAVAVVVFLHFLRSSEIRHRNELTAKAWGKALQEFSQLLTNAHSSTIDNHRPA